jgi:hypothetical protein
MLFQPQQFRVAITQLIVIPRFTTSQVALGLEKSSLGIWYGSPHTLKLKRQATDIARSANPNNIYLFFNTIAKEITTKDGGNSGNDSKPA